MIWLQLPWIQKAKKTKTHYYNRSYYRKEVLPDTKMGLGFRLDTWLHVKILNYTSENGQLVFACWKASTWLSWPAWTVLLTCMLEQSTWTHETSTHERTDLNNVVGTIMINQQPCSYMIEQVREWWKRCYNNHELGCCIKSDFAWSNIRKQPLLIRQAVYNMLKHDWKILLFYQSC